MGRRRALRFVPPFTSTEYVHVFCKNHSVLNLRTKILGLPSPTIIYVESFARVQSLSLTGKLLRPFVDRQVHCQSFFHVITQ